MENRKLGILIIVISFMFGTLLFFYAKTLYSNTMEIGCSSANYNDKCDLMESVMSWLHLGFFFFGFMFGLGFYFLFFDRTEKAIFQRLEKEKEIKINDIKFDILLKALDPFEQAVIKAVREQDGITQNTLRLRTNMSKAKLSYVLQELEKRGLVKRVETGKTLSVHLKF